ncbi:MAG: peptidase [Moorea sp. SIO4A3]|nr:peptidase [Moorena sp. SIO4A3]
MGSRWDKNDHRDQQRWIALFLGGVTCLLVMLIQSSTASGLYPKFNQLTEASSAIVASMPVTSPALPAPKPHPLPTPLDQWQDPTGSGDYFAEIKGTPLGYLIWSQFPVKVYVQQPQPPPVVDANHQRFQQWVDAVLKAVAEWGVYLPLELVDQEELADISILRSHPPLKVSLNRETGTFDWSRARAAVTSYEFYLGQSISAPEQIVDNLLLHKFTILLSPQQSIDYTLATARHELGHALGIWGHSPLKTDALYFSQVRNPPRISARDINTLKRIYEQPTRLGWPLLKVKAKS